MNFQEGDQEDGDDEDGCQESRVAKAFAEEKR